MSNEYVRRTFEPSEGKTVTLPENVERSKVENGRASVVGTGEDVEHIILETEEENVRFPSGTTVLGVGHPEKRGYKTPTLFYAVPKSQYGDNS